jgi:hypothetical protein
VSDEAGTEIARKLSEHGGPEKSEGSRARWEELVEILEAVVLAVVAISIAWSGYQAAKWDGLQAERYGEASTKRIDADQLLTLGGQQRLLDVSTFNTWIQAHAEGQTKLAALYVRRFSPEFKVAFDAWIETDPFTNPDAPPGPSFMPEYFNPLIDRGTALNREASLTFDAGTEARSHSDDYVRTTVVLATVLFLLALSQRLRRRNLRLGIFVVAGSLVIYALATVVTLPRH